MSNFLAVLDIAGDADETAYSCINCTEGKLLQNFSTGCAGWSCRQGW